MTHLTISNPWAFALLALLAPVVLWAALMTFDPVRGARKALVVALRVFVVIAVVSGLASVRWWTRSPEEKLCVLALVDVSKSVPASALDAAAPRIDELLSKADDAHSVGLVLFSGSARVAIPPDTKPPAPGAARKAIESARAKSPDAAPDADATNVERALDLAVSLFPAGAGRRIVLFSDGNATDGDALTRLSRCRASGVDVSTVLLSHDRAPFDLAVTSCRVPSRVLPSVGFDVKVGLSARAECDATLSLYRNGYLLEERPVRLAAGPREETFRQRLDDPGLYFYRAHVSTKLKQESVENDAAFAFTRLKTSPKALVLGETDLESRHLMSALRDGGVVAEFRTADGAPEQLADALDFDAVVLNNLRASALNGPQQRLLRDYVELFGGSLLVIGLDPVGGYSGSPVEEALPVVTDTDRLGKISTSVIVIADTSRSLILADREDRKSPGGGGEDLSRPEIIRRTSKQILAGLGDGDWYGLIGFGSEQYPPRWVVRPQKVYDRRKIESNIDDRLITSPRFPDAEALASVIARMAAPASPMEPEPLARAVEALADPLHLPHIQPRALMPFLRNRLHAAKEAINPDEIAQAVERELVPNAFLGRSNASRSILRAVSELKQRETARKGIILLTDGYLDGDTDYDRLSGQLAADGISVSTIALKEDDANKPALEGIARWGAGQCYRVDDPKTFSERFRRELESAARPRVCEFPFRARKVADSPLVRGVDVSVAPQLFGYVRTSPKLGARNILAVPPDYEPLLASWDFGAGRAAVFTSDAQERWASLWLRDWPQGFSRLWGSVLNGLCERSAGRRIIPQLDVSGPRVELAADFIDESNSFLNGEPLRARFYYLGEEGYVFSRTSAQEAAMPQVAPGRYACDYRATRKGVYVARISGKGPRDVASVGFVVSLLAEETTLTADEPALKSWASAGGGRFGGPAAEWTSLASKTRERAVDVSSWAMLLAAIAFTFDVVVRRWPAVARFLARRREGA